jgi:hypothetical protein
MFSSGIVGVAVGVASGVGVILIVGLLVGSGEGFTVGCCVGSIVGSIVMVDVGSVEVMGVGVGGAGVAVLPARFHPGATWNCANTGGMKATANKTTMINSGLDIVIQLSVYVSISLYIPDLYKSLSDYLSNPFFAI